MSEKGEKGFKLFMQRMKKSLNYDEKKAKEKARLYEASFKASVDRYFYATQNGSAKMLRDC